MDNVTYTVCNGSLFSQLRKKSLMRFGHIGLNMWYQLDLIFQECVCAFVKELLLKILTSRYFSMLKTQKRYNTNWLLYQYIIKGTWINESSVKVQRDYNAISTSTSTQSPSPDPGLKVLWLASIEKRIDNYRLHRSQAKRCSCHLHGGTQMLFKW